MNYDELHFVLAVGVAALFLVMLFATRGNQ